MSQTILYGSDASITMPSGIGALFSSFSINITQGIARAVGYGGTWVNKRGTVKDASGTIAGFTTHGSLNDVPGTAAMVRTGSSLTLTFASGCTLSGNAIFTGIGLSNEFTANANSSYSYEIDGTVTETWA
jgi:hypothetical protein